MIYSKENFYGFARSIGLKEEPLEQLCLYPQDVHNQALAGYQYLLWQSVALKTSASYGIFGNLALNQLIW